MRRTVRADRLDQAARALADVAARWDARLRRIKEIAETLHQGASQDASR